MKEAMTTIEYAQKLDAVEKEILKIKKGGAMPKAPISLYGILKGVHISPAAINAAKKSLFKKISL